MTLPPARSAVTDSTAGQGHAHTTATNKPPAHPAKHHKTTTNANTAAAHTNPEHPNHAAPTQQPNDTNDTANQPASNAG
jgi:hypothetical protein